MVSRTLRYVCGMAVCGLASTAAHAGFYSGNELYDVCTTERSSNAYVEKTFECVAYISGAVDAFNTTRAANGLKSCIPPDVTVSQLRSVTVDTLRNNPVDRNGPASALVFRATRKAWPCPNKK
ncbi:Rap1a/Tai family immunity protein [soil metagenome]